MTSRIVPRPLLSSLGFDVGAGLQFCGNDEGFYGDLIREFHEDILARRVRALREGDVEGRKAYAHMLKGTLRTLGATEASMKAHALELALRQGEPDRELADDLLTSLDEMHDALGHFLRNE